MIEQQENQVPFAGIGSPYHNMMQMPAPPQASRIPSAEMTFGGNSRVYGHTPSFHLSINPMQSGSYSPGLHPCAQTAPSQPQHYAAGHGSFDFSLGNFGNIGGVRWQYGHSIAPDFQNTTPSDMSSIPPPGPRRKGKKRKHAALILSHYQSRPR